MTLTPQQFNKAMSEAVDFATFSSSSVEFAKSYADNYAAAILDDHERELLRDLETLEVLALVEDGCTDVIANLPIIARIADDTGVLRLHILSRDSNRHIADLYSEDGHSRIPTYVFVTATGEDRGLLIERTSAMHATVSAAVQHYLDDHPAIDPSEFPYCLDANEQQELLEWAGLRRAATRDLERRTIVEVIRKIAVE